MTAIALSIAGSDSGGGAGVQADLKAFSALGVYGATVIAAVTAQNTRAVTDIHPIPPASIAAQIAALRDDLRLDAVKIGMLGGPEAIAAVAEGLEGLAAPIVLDPVMVAKSGDALLPDAAVEALATALLPRAALLTPNLPEAARLLNAAPARDAAGMAAQGRALLSRGAGAVLMKGGHASGAVCEDLLVTPEGVRAFRAPRIETKNTHGTGCSLSSAIAAGLARGLALEAAAGEAHAWLHAAIRAADALDVGHGHGPVHHFHALWPAAMARAEKAQANG